MKNIVSFKEVLPKARKEGYAVPHFNCNTIDWIRVVLKVAEEEKSPVIISGVDVQIKWMGGYEAFLPIIKYLVKEGNITVPVVVHLDHGRYEHCIKALNSGFTSVMFDGSYLNFQDNISKTKDVVNMAKEKSASVEAEVGAIGGEEGDIVTKVEIADPTECEIMSKIGIDLLASGIGNIHGEYPDDWQGLRFDVLEKINKKANMPLSLHGGSGVPDDQIKKAIKNGIAKINVHTEVLIGYVDGLLEHVYKHNFKDVRDPITLHKYQDEGMKKIIRKKIRLFGSNGKA